MSCCISVPVSSICRCFQTEKQSLGVRMALGETQIVSETREFLIDNGVVLDSFSQVTPAATIATRLTVFAIVFTKHTNVI